MAEKFFLLINFYPFFVTLNKLSLKNNKNFINMLQYLHSANTKTEAEGDLWAKIRENWKKTWKILM
jgi:hypothetical protein